MKIKIKILFILIFATLLSGCVGENKITLIQLDTTSEIKCIPNEDGQCWIISRLNDVYHYDEGIRGKGEYRSKFNDATIIVSDLRDGFLRDEVANLYPKSSGTIEIRNVGFYEEENDMVTVYGDIKFDSEVTPLKYRWSDISYEDFDLATVYLTIRVSGTEKSGYKENIKIENIEKGETVPFSVTIHVGNQNR